MQTGAVRWQTKVEDNTLGFSITAAPLAIDGRVIVGISGGEAGVRGFLDAYDAKAGAGGFYARCGFAERGRVVYKGDPLIYYERLLR